MHRLTLLISIFYLTACSTTSGSNNTFTPMSVNDGQAAVYIYRPPMMANSLYSPDLYINDELKLSIKNGKNSRLVLPAGEYKFELQADNNSSDLTSLSLKLSPESTSYIRITTSLNIKSATNYEPYQRSFNIEHVNEKQAITQIAKCCVSNNKKSVAESPDNKTDDGFSVDKTQNPFSH
ncbi:MAG: hypothetical protein ACC650_00945 [Gammaproteobacteria bacterium]